MSQFSYSVQEEVCGILSASSSCLHWCPCNQISYVYQYKVQFILSREARPLLLLFCLSLFLKFYLLSLKTDRKTEKNFVCLVHFSNGYNSQHWAAQKAGTRSQACLFVCVFGCFVFFFFPEFSQLVQGAKFLDHVPLLSLATSMEMKWKWNSQDLKQHRYRIPVFARGGSTSWAITPALLCLFS